jgi:hypothetical protein
MERDFDYLALWQAAKRAASGRAIHKTVLVAGLVVLHSLFGLGIIRRAAIAQEVMGQYRWRIAAGSTVLAADSENAMATKPGSDFKECANGCPVMIVVPAGKFVMGLPWSKSDPDASERPLHEVTIANHLWCPAESWCDFFLMCVTYQLTFLRACALKLANPWNRWHCTRKFRIVRAVVRLDAIRK